MLLYCLHSSNSDCLATIAILLESCWALRSALDIHFLSLYMSTIASHCLNLAVVSSFEEVAVRNIIGIVNRVSTFFSAHPKRQRKLEEAIETTKPESSVHMLVKHDGLRG